MKKHEVLQSLEIWNVSYKQLSKKERAEMFFPQIALLCHGERFKTGFYLTGNNWQEVFDLFLNYYVGNPFGDN